MPRYSASSTGGSAPVQRHEAVDLGLLDARVGQGSCRALEIQLERCFVVDTAAVRRRRAHDRHAAVRHGFSCSLFRRWAQARTRLPTSTITRPWRSCQSGEKTDASVTYRNGGHEGATIARIRPVAGWAGGRGCDRCPRRAGLIRPAGTDDTPKETDERHHREPDRGRPDPPYRGRHLLDHPQPARRRERHDAVHAGPDRRLGPRRVIGSLRARRRDHRSRREGLLLRRRPARRPADARGQDPTTRPTTSWAMRRA